MPIIEVNGVAYAHPGGSELFSGVTFRVAHGRHAALVGPNGVGKSTLLQLIDGSLPPSEGSVSVDGDLQLMPQSIGVTSEHQSVRDLLVAFSPTRLAGAARSLAAAEHANDHDPSHHTGIALAEAVTEWAAVGGYQTEARWDDCCQRVLRQPLAVAGARSVGELSGGERKRLVLESVFASDADTLLLDEPDNFLDLAGKRWLERQIANSPKTILVISHDRELIAAAADSIVTLEGFGAWVHPGSFSTYDGARRARHVALANDLERWQTEEQRLRQYYRTMKQRAASNDGNAGRADAAESRWQRFVAAGPPPPPPSSRDVKMKLVGARAGALVVEVRALEIAGLTDPFDVEIWKDDRIAVLGPNGSGKSHFLRLLAGDDTIETAGRWRLGAGVHQGLFHQTDDVAWLTDRTPIESLAALDVGEEPAMAALARYGLEDGARRDYSTLSGGQKARLQVLGLELRGVNLLLLDEPTDNLDMSSAEALEEALAGFQGTVLSVTHDRWFMRSFDRFLVFDHDCSVKEVLDLETALHLVSRDDSYGYRRSAVRELTVGTPTASSAVGGSAR